MKKIWERIILTTLCSLFILAGCSNPVDGTNDNTKNNDSGGSETNADYTADIAAAKKLLDLADSVIPNGSIVEIELPSEVSGYSGVSISWASNNTIITVNGNTGYVSSPSISTPVTMTATLSEGTVSDTETFVVKVFSQTDTNITNEDYLEAAKAALSVEYDTDSATQVITLPTELENFDTTVTWKTSNTNKASLYSSSSVTRCTFYGSISDSTVTLTATLTRNSKTTTKQFVLTLPKITQARYYFENLTYNNVNANSTEKYVFEANTITYTYTVNADSDDTVLETKGTKYTFTADDDKNIITVSVSQSLLNGIWYTKSEAGIYGKNLCNEMFNAWEDCESSPTKESLLKVFVPGIFGKSYSEVTSSEIDKAINYLLSSGYFSVSTVADFKSASDSSLTSGIKKCMSYLRNSICSNLCLDTSSSISTISEKELEVLEESINTKYFENADYAYNVRSSSYYGTTNSTQYPDGVWFTARSQWDDSKAWNLQTGKYAEDDNGNYGWHAPGYSHIDDVKFYANGYYGSDAKTVCGTFDASFSTFTDKDSKVWNISLDKTNHQITFTSGSDTYTFVFVGTGLDD